MKKYLIGVCKYGCIPVEAESYDDAERIASECWPCAVLWEDGWVITDSHEDVDGEVDNDMYIRG